MNEQEFNSLVEKMETALGGKVSKEVQEAIKGLDVEGINALLQKDLLTQADVADFATKAGIDELTEKINELKDAIEAGDGAQPKTLAEEIKENKGKLKGILRGMRDTFVVKANTLRSSITNSTSGYVLPDIGQLARKERSLYDVLPKITVPDGNNGGSIKYVDWDQATAVAAANAVAEGAAFPESTAAFQEYSLDLVKVGDVLPVSEEFGEDEMMAAAELDRFLAANVDSKVDQQLAAGTGAGGQVKGLTASATAYTPAASGITDANLKDLVIKMHESIVTNYGGKYSPDIVVMSTATFNTYALKKDSQNRYLFNESDNTIAGMAIVIDNNMAANTLVVGDRRFATIYEKPGVEISEGYTGTQFAGDLKTIKARKRINLLVRTVDATGFSYSDDVAADITTLAT